MTITKSIGTLLLAIFLILYAVLYFIGIKEGGLILALVALFAGIFLLIGR